MGCVCCAGVKLLASKLVEQWLKIVKGETEAVRAQHMLPATASEAKASPAEHATEEPSTSEEAKHENAAEPKVEIEKLAIKSEEETECEPENAGDFDVPIGQLPVLKITLKDGKRVLAKVFSGDKAQAQKDDAEITDSSDVSEKLSSSGVSKPSESVSVKTEDVKMEVEDPSVKVSSEVHKPSSSKSKVKSEKLESSDVQKSVKDSGKKSKESSSSKSVKDKKSSKDKVRSKDKSKDKSRDNSKVKEKDKKSNILTIDKMTDISEKDRATLAKLIPPAISKLGKIPKKPKTDEVPKPAPATEAKKPSANEVKKPAPAPEPVVTKKPSISIESRKLGDPGNRPKTVKTFNSKFRSTGLEEEAKPPPSRQGKKAVPPVEKKPPSVPAKLPSLKRPSPPKELPTPPEKKMKPAVADSLVDDGKKEKSGGIKLIPPRPKRKYG